MRIHRSGKSAPHLWRIRVLYLRKHLPHSGRCLSAKGAGLALLLCLALALPSPALALRNESALEAGLEEELQRALADPTDPFTATAQTLADRLTRAFQPAAGLEEDAAARFRSRLSEVGIRTSLSDASLRNLLGDKSIAPGALQKRLSLPRGKVGSTQAQAAYQILLELRADVEQTQRQQRAAEWAARQLLPRLRTFAEGGLQDFSLLARMGREREFPGELPAWERLIGKLEKGVSQRRAAGPATPDADLVLWLSQRFNESWLIPQDLLLVATTSRPGAAAEYVSQQRVARIRNRENVRIEGQTWSIYSVEPMFREDAAIPVSAMVWDNRGMFVVRLDQLDREAWAPWKYERMLSREASAEPVMIRTSSVPLFEALMDVLARIRQRYGNQAAYRVALARNGLLEEFRHRLDQMRLEAATGRQFLGVLGREFLDSFVQHLVATGEGSVLRHLYNQPTLWFEGGLVPIERLREHLAVGFYELSAQLARMVQGENPDIMLAEWLFVIESFDLTPTPRLYHLIAAELGIWLLTAQLEGEAVAGTLPPAQTAERRSVLTRFADWSRRLMQRRPDEIQAAIQQVIYPREFVFPVGRPPSLQEEGSAPAARPATPPAGGLEEKIESGAAGHIGDGSRDKQEDAYSPEARIQDPEGTLLGIGRVVADGVGGMAAGELASAEAVTVLQQAMHSPPLAWLLTGFRAAADEGAASDLVRRMLLERQNAFRLAGKRLLSLRSHPKAESYSTTAVEAIVLPQGRRGRSQGIVTWQGDSRAYHWHAATRTLDLITLDDSLRMSIALIDARLDEEDLIRNGRIIHQGQLNELGDSVRHSTAANYLSSLPDNLPPNGVAVDLEPGDRILLLTDGVIERWDRQQLEAQINAGPADETPQQMADRLIGAAESGDNRTVAILELAARPATPPAGGLEEEKGGAGLGVKRGEWGAGAALSGRGAFGGDQWHRELSPEGKPTEPLPEQTTSSQPPFFSGARRQASETQFTMPATNTTFNPTKSFPKISPANAPANRILEKSASVFDNTSRRPSDKIGFATASSVPQPLERIKAAAGPATPPAGGLEEYTARAAKRLRHLLTEEGKPAPPLAELLGDSSSDADWVRAFVALLRAAPNTSVSALPEGFLAVSPDSYRDNLLFTRQELSDPQAAEYVFISDGYPTLKKILEGVARQINEGAARLQKPVTPEDLGLSTLQELYADLFFARDESGNLFIAGESEFTVYRWLYRDIPRLLAPRTAAEWIPPGDLREALRNPLRLTNDEGNDAVQRAIHALVSNPESGFTDQPDQLTDPEYEYLKRWGRLALAANLVDYSHASILEEIQREGDMARYILGRMDTDFLDTLGGERHLEELLRRLGWPGTALAYLPDNNGQLAASLKWAEVLLATYPALSIRMILKGDNGVLNDASVADARRLISIRHGVPDIYSRLRGYERDGRFSIVRGPSHHGMPLDLLPADALSALQQADVVFAEGEANTCSLNGLAKKELYLGLRLKWPDGVTRVFGLERTPQIAAQRPPALIRIDGTRGLYYHNPYQVPEKGPRWTILQTLQQQSAKPPTPLAAGLEEAEKAVRDWFQATLPQLGTPDEQAVKTLAQDPSALTTILPVWVKRISDEAGLKRKIASKWSNRRYLANQLVPSLKAALEKAASKALPKPKAVSTQPSPIDPRVLDPKSPLFEIGWWVLERYIKTQAPLTERLEQGELTGEEVMGWVEQIIRPLQPNFDLKDTVPYGKQKVDLYQLQDLADEILEQVMIPNGFILIPATFRPSRFSYGRILPEETEVVTSPAGRPVPVYTVQLSTPLEEFGVAVAKTNLILVPTEAAEGRIFLETYHHVKELWRAYQQGLFRPPSPHEDPRSPFGWVALQFYGPRSLGEAQRLERAVDLAEELSHSDTSYFLESLWGRRIRRRRPGETMRIAQAILQPQASLRQLLGQGGMDEAMVEIEGKLNALRHSPYPAKTFVEFLQGTILPAPPEALEPSSYPQAYRNLLLLLSEPLLGKATLDQGAWLRYLDKAVLDIEGWNEQLREAADIVYPREFLTQEDRGRLLKEAEGSGPSPAAGLEEVRLYDGYTEAGTGQVAAGLEELAGAGLIRPGERRAVVTRPDAEAPGIGRLFIGAGLPMKDFAGLEERRLPENPAGAVAFLEEMGANAADLIVLPLEVAAGMEERYRPAGGETPIVVMPASGLEEAGVQALGALAQLARHLGGVYRVSAEAWAGREYYRTYDRELMSISY